MYKTNKENKVGIIVCEHPCGFSTHSVYNGVEFDVRVIGILENSKIEKAEKESELYRYLTIKYPVDDWERAQVKRLVENCKVYWVPKNRKYRILYLNSGIEYLETEDNIEWDGLT